MIAGFLFTWARRRFMNIRRILPELTHQNILMYGISCRTQEVSTPSRSFTHYPTRRA
ncbi:protein of unknown function [Nitrospira japonica]|uniref:Uncharacterized protein n=1 Tax=Nitrospira japonica TaxID=1325564 RepID=A0A1W1I770_9BACT|nr:protein of unknown function [Nitrospira japonica]